MLKDSALATCKGFGQCERRWNLTADTVVIRSKSIHALFRSIEHDGLQLEFKNPLTWYCTPHPLHSPWQFSYKYRCYCHDIENIWFCASRCGCPYCPFSCQNKAKRVSNKWTISLLILSLLGLWVHNYNRIYRYLVHLGTVRR